VAQLLRWVIRLGLGGLAVLLYLVARGIRQSFGGGPFSSPDRVLGTILHTVAAILTFLVFFQWKRTRVSSLVPLAELPLERSLPGAEQRISADLARLRRRLSSLCFAGGGVTVVMVIWLLAGAAYFGAAAQTIVTRRFAPSDLALTLIAASLALWAGLCVRSERRWALVLASVTAVLFSFAFPLGLIFAIYAWWIVRSLAGQSRVGDLTMQGELRQAAT
jgi:hypothetical protein